MTMRRVLILLMITSLIFIFTSCDDDPTGPDGDVAAPRVSGVSPAPNAVGVPVDAPMSVTFNEPMASMTPAALAGMVTLSHGDVTAAAWTSTTTLTLTHTPWPAATVVTATFAAAFEDTAGNALSEEYSYSFTTAAVEVNGPTVILTRPAPGDDHVYAGQTIDVIFSEDMDPATAAGNLALSHGSITGTNWPMPHVLEIRHDDWPASTEITVTVGAALANPAGETLPADHVFSFTTDSNTPSLLQHVPADGAVDVPRNVTILLEFSRDMNRASLDGALTVSTAAKVPLAYVLDGGGEEWTVDFPDGLPSSTSVMVSVAATAEDIYGQAMGEAYDFSFTTSAAIDETPPQLLSASPANGATVSTSTATMQFTFDEAIDDLSLNPRLMSGQFAMTMWASDQDPQWNPERTVITLDLGAPLQPGTVYRIEFDSFADISGNVNTEGFDYEFTVEGEPDYHPVVDGRWFAFAGHESTSVPDKDDGYFFDMVQIEVTGGPGEFLRKSWDEWEAAFNDWDMYTLTANGVLFRGFHDGGDGPGDGMDILFSPSIEWMRFPVTAESWSGTAMFSEAEPGGPDRVNYELEYLSGTHDVLVTDPGGSSPPLGKESDDDPALLWMGCRKAVLQYGLSDGTNLFSAGVDTLWFAPGVGLVRETNLEDEGDEIRTSASDLIWMGDSFPGDLHR